MRLKSRRSSRQKFSKYGVLHRVSCVPGLRGIKEEGEGCRVKCCECLIVPSLIGGEEGEAPLIAWARFCFGSSCLPPNFPSTNSQGWYCAL
jgi:hypothetical protein